MIQGSIDSTLDSGEDIRETTYSQYFNLTRWAVNKYGKLDLVIWPEIFFLYPLVVYDEDAGTKDQWIKDEKIDLDEYRKWLQSCVEASRLSMTDTAKAFRCPLITGMDTHHYSAEGERVYNTAAYMSAEGKLLGRYDKMHLVTFGEYIPFADYSTWINKLTPLTLNTTPGKNPEVFQLGDILIAPNICYESVLPHVIRRQINELKARGKRTGHSGEYHQRRLVLGLQRTGHAPGLRGVSGGGISQTVSDRREHGIFGLDRRRWKYRRKRPKTANRSDPGPSPTGPSKKPVFVLRRLAGWNLPCGLLYFCRRWCDAISISTRRLADPLLKTIGHSANRGGKGSFTTDISILPAIKSAVELLSILNSGVYGGSD